jgi:hypothetical protein
VPSRLVVGRRRCAGSGSIGGGGGGEGVGCIGFGGRGKMGLGWGVGWSAGAVWVGVGSPEVRRCVGPCAGEWVDRWGGGGGGEMGLVRQLGQVPRRR